MTQFLFYLNYAYRNIRRGGRWTTLAIFCIAAGVATIVALRSLGLAIGDSLTNNVRADNKGDLRLFKVNGDDAFGSFFTFGEDATAFTVNELNAVNAWVQERGGKISAFTRGGSFTIASVDETAFGRPQSVSALIINPQTYPPTHTIYALEPGGVPLPDLFTDGYDVVISQNLADLNQLKIGDQVRVTGTEQPFTVRGIVATSEEAGLRNIFGAFFGFAYLDLNDAKATLGAGIDPNTIAVAFDNPPMGEALIAAARDLRAISSTESGGTRSQSAEALLERYETVAQLLGDFIVVLGLGALLIGGVGIMNTMLVMVRRRTIEIAALKTFGLKSRQIALLFLAEGLLLGLAGSVLGSIIGVLLSGVVNRYGETFLQQQIVWKLYPEALLYGFALGMVITTIFGLAPILSALGIRPAIILRPNDNHIARMGIVQSLGLMLVMTLAIGLVVGQIIRPSFGLTSRFATETPYLVGIVSVAGTLLFLGFLVGILWLIVWLVGKFPTFGNVTLQLALRNLSTNRLRTATTLLALCSGMFALSSITYVGEGTRQLLNLQLAQQFGGNVLVFPLAPGRLAGVGEFAVNNALNTVQGIESRTTIYFYDLELLTVDGQPINDNVNLDRETAREFSTRNLDTDELAAFNWSNVIVWDSTNPQVYDAITLVAGRNLTLADRGKRYIIGSAEYAAALNIQIGSKLVYRLNGDALEFEVVGLTGSSFGSFGGGGTVMPPAIFAASAADFQLYTLQVAPEHVNEALVALSTIRIPPTFALDVTFIDSFLSRLINQFAAIPTVVGLLSLFAAAVIMANTVALSTLERRRQIGVLKSIGLKGQRVLVIMLIETGIIGLLSAGLGIGLSVVFVTLLTALGGTPIPIPDDARLLTAGLVIAALVIAWIATFLSAGVAVRERVMNVLRYE
jgi:predicted lysophospholipase L1 biosynthesis ABC-type transport system permease subunit